MTNYKAALNCSYPQLKGSQAIDFSWWGATSHRRWGLPKVGSQRLNKGDDPLVHLLLPETVSRMLLVEALELRVFM